MNLLILHLHSISHLILSVSRWMWQLWADHLLAVPLFSDHVFNSSLCSIVIGYTRVHWPRVSRSPSWVTAQTELQLSTVSMCLMAPWRANYCLFKRGYWLNQDQCWSGEREVIECAGAGLNFAVFQGLRRNFAEFVKVFERLDEEGTLTLYHFPGVVVRRVAGWW